MTETHTVPIARREGDTLLPEERRPLVFERITAHVDPAPAEPGPVCGRDGCDWPQHVPDATRLLSRTQHALLAASEHLHADDLAAERRIPAPIEPTDLTAGRILPADLTARAITTTEPAVIELSLPEAWKPAPIRLAEKPPIHTDGAALAARSRAADAHEAACPVYAETPEACWQAHPGGVVPDPRLLHEPGCREVHDYCLSREPEPTPTPDKVDALRLPGAWADAVQAAADAANSDDTWVDTLCTMHPVIVMHPADAARARNHRPGMTVVADPAAAPGSATLRYDVPLDGRA